METTAEPRPNLRTELIAGVTTFFTVAYVESAAGVNVGRRGSRRSSRRSASCRASWGFISHAGLYLVAGRGREVRPVMYALALVSVGLLMPERFA